MSEELLREVANWKLEAKLEDNQRYFFDTTDINRIENGSRCYVIGRKGTGKTALSEHLYQVADAGRFSEKLNFKNFPFNDLYALENKSYKNPNQYITLWKYIIYSSIAKMMITNENIDEDARRQLKHVYSEDVERSLARNISKWTSKTFGISILGYGGNTSVAQASSKNDTSWIDRVTILEKFIEKNIDNAKYLIIFDELDEDYKDITVAERHEQYTSLLAGLIKAVQDVKSVFRPDQYQILPVIFLRDDIYDLIQDADKTKWKDLSIELDWNKTQIQKLLAFRLSRAIDPNGPILTFNETWNKMFALEDVSYGSRQKKKISSFEFITRSTQLRPRDYIRYMQACAEDAIAQRKQQVHSQTIVHVDKAFSNYLRSEMEDEIHGILPDISHILDTIAHIRKQDFSQNEFASAYNEEVEHGYLQQRSIIFVLRILFHFSVIGNQPRQHNFQVFRYSNKEARFNLNERICLHRGLYKALQIY